MIVVTRSPKNDSFILQIGTKKREYPVQEMPQEFISWNIGSRITMLERMLASDETSHHKGAGGAGFHLPVVITNNPSNTLFPFNAAVKGTGFVAKEEFLDYYIALFQKVLLQTEVPQDASDEQKARAKHIRITTIMDFYNDKNKIDLRCLGGLEIWPGQTSKNFVADPRVSLHFVGMPLPGSSKYQQWQVNCIWEKIVPSDKRFIFGVALRALTMGNVGRSFVPAHIPTEQTPIKGNHPFGWNMWVIQTIDKGIAALHQ